MDAIDAIGGGLLKLLKEGPLGGLALGLAFGIWALTRAFAVQAKLDAEKDAHRLTSKEVAVLADTYARMIAAQNEKKAAREIRLAKEAEAATRAVARGGRRSPENAGGDPHGTGGDEES